MSIKVLFQRFGFANNSSSSHSVVFISQPERDDVDGHFGWDFFTATSKESKSNYLLSTLYDNLIDLVFWRLKAFNHFKSYIGLDEDYLRNYVFDQIMKHPKMIEVFGTVESAETYEFYGIDHQSLITLPVNHFTDEIDIDFFAELAKAMLNENVAILGGNDNTDESHPLSGEAPNWYNYLSVDNGFCNAKSMYDDFTDTWILINNSGDETRISFNDENKVIERSGFPTLVDIKITDYCNQGCKFCYQSSTEDGKHAPYYGLGKNYSSTVIPIHNIAKMLKDTGSLQVVLGGGEPTKHPEIAQIISAFSKFNLSLTTRNYEWLSDNTYVPYWVENINSVAISVTTPNDVKNAAKLKEILTAKKVTVSAQTILGVTKATDVQQFLEACVENGFKNVTFLGYKDFGLGTKYTPQHLDNEWIAIAKEYSKAPHWLKISVDSVVVAQYGGALQDAGVPFEFLDCKEGKYSCYIDAVKGNLQASSFTDEFVQLPSNKDDFIKAWRAL